MLSKGFERLAVRACIARQACAGLDRLAPRQHMLCAVLHIAIAD